MNHTHSAGRRKADLTLKVMPAGDSQLPLSSRPNGVSGGIS